MLRSSRTPLGAVVVAFLAHALPVAALPSGGTRGATCQADWQPTFVAPNVPLGTLNASAVFDDGSGAALYVGGSFSVASGVAATNVARWNGTSWEPVGAGLNGTVLDLLVHDDGGGPALYAAGSFPFGGGLARWKGSVWQAVGGGLSQPSGSFAGSLAVFDDGNGPALYVGGSFSAAGSTSGVGNVARWNGSTWSSLAGGMNHVVNDLEPFDDGSGPGLFAVGPFTLAGSTVVNKIARWNGTTWSALPWVENENIDDLQVYAGSNGTTPRLYLAGKFGVQFPSPHADTVVTWDGTQFATVPGQPDLGSQPIGGPTPSVGAMTVLDDGSGSGPRLFVRGNFSEVGGQPAARVAAWNGSAWSALAEGVSSVGALLPHPVAGGTRLLAPGNGEIAIWNGAAGSWTRWDPRLRAQGREMVVYDDGSCAGPRLVAYSPLRAWNGSAWSDIGTVAFDTIRALAVYDGPVTGAELFAGGTFTSIGGTSFGNIARWTGTSWNQVGSGVNGDVYALLVHDDGSGEALYAGGTFTVAGGQGVGRVARWNGVGWSPLGPGVTFGVRSLGAFDSDGGGADLYLGGTSLARWNGATMTTLASFGGNEVLCMTVFDDGGGPALFIGGSFLNVPGTSARHVARYDGVTWANLGVGTNDDVRALCAFDDGNGAALYAAGDFISAGGVPAKSIARWNGLTWSPLGAGIEGLVENLLVADVGGGPSLIVGGTFPTSPAGDAWVARYGCPATVDDAVFCLGEESACPCGNCGSPGRGCDNAQGTGGVALQLVAQNTSPASATVAGTGFPAFPWSAPTVIVIRSSALEPSPIPFGDGLRCVPTTGLVRLAPSTAVAGTSTHTFGHGAGPGTYYYQLWYRNQPQAFCTSSGFNLSSGLRITW